MTADIPDFENVSGAPDLRSDTKALQSVSAKQKDRDSIASDIEAFLARGGQIECVQNGVSASYNNYSADLD